MSKIFKSLLFLLLLSSPLLAWDSDGDGIPNKYDECKKEPEDFDGFQDQDGCPEPDNDKDGVLDDKDKCNLQPEDRDGFQDDDGCPDPDNDKDGILDVKDKCPLKKEDFDAYQDMDGCPDPDNDKDGILDVNDKCPMDAEDKDGFQDTDGCPDFDNDKDGIKDKQDKCPNESETFNEVDDEDGCPDLGILPIEKKKTYKDVAFRIGTGDLTFESFRSLDSLAQKLTIFKTIKLRVHIFAEFTKDVENSLNILSTQQEGLINYLVSKGAMKEQFIPIDYTIEWYESVKTSEWDPNESRKPVIRVVDPSELIPTEATPTPPADSVDSAVPESP